MNPQSRLGREAPTGAVACALAPARIGPPMLVMPPSEPTCPTASGQTMPHRRRVAATARPGNAARSTWASFTASAFFQINHVNAARQPARAWLVETLHQVANHGHAAGVQGAHHQGIGTGSAITCVDMPTAPGAPAAAPPSANFCKPRAPDQTQSRTEANRPCQWPTATSSAAIICAMRLRVVGVVRDHQRIGAGVGVDRVVPG